MFTNMVEFFVTLQQQKNARQHARTTTRALLLAGIRTALETPAGFSRRLSSKIDLFMHKLILGLVPTTNWNGPVCIVSLYFYYTQFSFSLNYVVYLNDIFITAFYCFLRIT